MRFLDFYKTKDCRYSLEVFPPKTEAGIEKLIGELKALKTINPAYISVTYGAMGSTQSLTHDLVLKIHKQVDVPTAFHFTCVGSGQKEIKAYVDDLYEQGINLVVALRGDRPQDPDYVPPQDGFSYANELVAYLKGLHDFSIAVAGYPEKHIEAPSLEQDLVNLKRKVDAGADIIITQLFFDNQDYFDYVTKVRDMGITVPVIPGILPVRSLKQIERIIGFCGAKFPQSLRQRLESCQDDPAKMVEAGIEHASEQCRELVDKDAAGIHFYCLNQAESVLKVVESLK